MSFARRASSTRRVSSRIGAAGDWSAAASSSDTSTAPPHFVQRAPASPPTACPAAACVAQPLDGRARWSHRRAAETRPALAGPGSGPRQHRVGCLSQGAASRRPAAVLAASSKFSCGPHAGQAIGWAWNRRSPGSSYSARQRGTCGSRHRGARPVVRQLLDDRPARPAVGAVGERIAIAALLGHRRSPAGTRRRWPDRRESWDAVPLGRN